ncbi:glycosyltransferase [Rathayibacter sp. YIM 133350]|uniref:glycosyltransferase n=1 Tax=Rathayibacter sp. YIM 133350 TaxID=3131992 RepID=UPI00307F5EF9
MRRLSPASPSVRGSIIIPAHNEEASIPATLAALQPLLDAGTTEVIVSCNGCTDSTARIAREHPGVRVIETEVASKVVALNAADAAATLWPRMYLDADILIEPSAVAAVFGALAADEALAARPLFRYEVTGASAGVRAYYRARQRIPSTSGALWGAGVYALSRRGRDRFVRFPDLVADDLYIDSIFADHEKAVIETEPVLVTTPRTSAGLLAVLARQSRGNAEQPGTTASGSTVRELARSARSAGAAYDAAAYLTYSLLGRWRALRSRGPRVWERDESSRGRPAASH